MSSNKTGKDGYLDGLAPLTSEQLQKDVDNRKPEPTLDEMIKEDGRKDISGLLNPRPSIPAITHQPIPQEGHYREPRTGRIVPSISEAEEAVKTLLLYIGENPERDGLKETPKRVVRALREMTRGYYDQGPEVILSKVFDQSYDEVIVVRNIPFVSLCEHHMLPYNGTVDIGYLPGASSSHRRSPPPDLPSSEVHTRVVGLSKLARLVDYYSKRLTIQERLTQQIAQSIAGNLHAQGVGVIIRAQHSCMSCRGVTKPGSEMVTSCMLGVFRTKPEARAELLSLRSK